MKILVVGSGGREHAMVRALATTPGLEILAAPGNPGMAGHAELVDVAAGDIDGIVDLATTHAVDLVVPGPEVPLVAGLADALIDAGVACAGPSAAAARLEASKSFTRQLTDDAGVPSPAYRIVTSQSEIDAAVADFDAPPVVKADGLAAGKGVLLPDTVAACRDAAHDILSGRFGAAGSTVVFEERLVGVEASLFYACRGTDLVALPNARDHKRLLDGDRGPNTGGMGAISPNPLIDDDLADEVTERIVRPTVRALEVLGAPFAGFLFAGLMITGDGPRLLEYNVRLGDPEAQAILPRMGGGSFLDVCRWVAGVDAVAPSIEIDSAPVCAVVLAAEGYPEAPRLGPQITVDPALESDDRWLVHAATRRVDGSLVVDGGRVAAVVARGASAAEARRAAYEGVALVRWERMTYRTDIGAPGGNDG